jgi:small subunit ribosomal protein S9
VSDDAERDQDDAAADAGQPDASAEEQPAPEQPQANEAEGAAEQPAADAEGQPEAAAEGEEASVEGGETPAEDGEADAEAEGSEPSEPAPRPKREKAKDSGGKEVVPGADLEPIAISEEERELTAEERAAREAEEEERRAREAAATSDDDDDTIAPRSVSVPADTRIQATGKRKSAVARVVVRAGEGSFQINDRGIDEYFKSSQHQSLARQPLVATGFESSLDVRVRVHGGGVSGQAGAVRHGVARALTALEPELRGDLKRRGMLTRDDRRKERKKAGLKKARKRPQFSKR